jgi:hypothetical protein
MQSILSRAARRPLAQMIVILAAAGAFTACAESTTAPAVNASSLTTANPAEAPSPEAYTTSVDLVVERVADSDAYGTVLRLGVTCSAKTVFDVNVELEQSVKVGKGRQTIQSSNTFTAYACDEGHTSINFMVSPTDAKLTFEPGRGTVHAWIANYQPGVEPADITTRTRIVVD